MTIINSDKDEQQGIETRPAHACHSASPFRVDGSGLFGEARDLSRTGLSRELCNYRRRRSRWPSFTTRDVPGGLCLGGGYWCEAHHRQKRHLGTAVAGLTCFRLHNKKDIQMRLATIGLAAALALTSSLAFAQSGGSGGGGAGGASGASGSAGMSSGAGTGGTGATGTTGSPGSSSMSTGMTGAGTSDLGTTGSTTGSSMSGSASSGLGSGTTGGSTGTGSNGSGTGR
jgi:hypothetical protein